MTINNKSSILVVSGGSPLSPLSWRLRTFWLFLLLFLFFCVILSVALDTPRLWVAVRLSGVVFITLSFLWFYVILLLGSCLSNGVITVSLTRALFIEYLFWLCYTYRVGSYKWICFPCLCSRYFYFLMLFFCDKMLPWRVYIIKAILFDLNISWYLSCFIIIL